MSDFLAGQLDCKNGIEPKDGQSQSYDDGYAYQSKIMEQKDV